jgi:hypothetical protein
LVVFFGFFFLMPPPSREKSKRIAGRQRKLTDDAMRDDADSSGGSAAVTTAAASANIGPGSGQEPADTTSIPSLNHSVHERLSIHEQLTVAALPRGKQRHQIEERSDEDVRVTQLLGNLAASLCPPQVAIGDVGAQRDALERAVEIIAEMGLASLTQNQHGHPELKAEKEKGT